MQRRTLPRPVSVAALLAAAAALVAGCTGEGDLQARWEERIGDAAGVASIREFSCSSTTPGAREHCQLTLRLDDSPTPERLQGIVERYVESAPEVYDAEGVDVGQALGRLVLEADGDRTLAFDPDDGDSLAREWAETFIELLDDERFQDAEVADEALRLTLPPSTPAETYDVAEAAARDFDRAQRVTVVGRATDEGDPVAKLVVSIDRGELPAAQWRLAGRFVAGTSGERFEVTVGPGPRVHLVRLGVPEGARTDDPEQVRLRAELEALAPDGIATSLGFTTQDEPR